MRICISVFLFVLLVPFASSADPLTKEELFDLYANTVDHATIAQRMDQLFSNLPDGEFKTTAKNTLKQDLLDALTAQIEAVNTSIAISNAERIAAVNRLGAAVTELDSYIAEQQNDVIPPIEELQTNVGDTDL